MRLTLGRFRLRAFNGFFIAIEVALRLTFSECSRKIEAALKIQKDQLKYTFHIAHIRRGRVIFEGTLSLRMPPELLATFWRTAAVIAHTARM